MKKKIFLSLFFLATSSQLYALDLVEAYQRAKQSDPSWQANLYQYQADQLNLGIARTNFCRQSVSAVILPVNIREVTKAIV